MTVMTSKHFTGAFVAIDRVLQKQNNDNPNQKLDGPLLLSYAQTPQGSEIKGYIHKFAQNGLKGWAEEFGNKINVINHREVLSMKMDIIVAQKVHEALTQSAISSYANGATIKDKPSFDIKSSDRESVVDKISTVVSEIANHGDRISQSKLQTVLTDGLDKVLNNPKETNELLSDAVKKVVASNTKEQSNNFETKQENRKSSDNSFDIG